MRGSFRKTVEVVLVISVYILFLTVGVYSGQTTMTIDIISPHGDVELQSSPVELGALVTIRGVPVSNVSVTFTVLVWGIGETKTDTSTDAKGVAKILFPASSGNYTWYATVRREGYPLIVSRYSNLSIRLLLAIDALVPSQSVLAVSPVNFKARVSDMQGHLVESANVTFYVDSVMIGSSLTGANGIARLSKPVDTGNHIWFASACKDGECGISAPTMFLVGA